MLPTLRRNWVGNVDEPIIRFQQEMDSLFDRFFGGGDGGGLRSWTNVPLSMWEDEDHVYIEAELPGVVEEDVDVTVHNGMLFIRGECRAPQGRNLIYNSRMFGRFERVVALPATVDPDHVQARLANGLLDIELSKSAEARPKKIAITKG